jgi:hypothetical protein
MNRRGWSGTSTKGITAINQEIININQEIDGLDTDITALEAKVNTPAQQSLNLTELSQIQSVTDSYNGISEVEIGGATLNQVVVNGDFSNGTTGWTIVGGAGGRNTITVTNKATFNGEATATGGYSQILPSVKQNDKVAILFDAVYSTGTKPELQYGQIGVSTVPISYNNGSNCIVVTVTAPSDFGVYLRQVAGATYANVSFDNIKTVPMTGMYFENYTPDQMNALVNTYWEGLRSTQSVELGSRGRNLFDANSPNVILNKRVNGLSGTEISIDGSSISDYIRVKPSTNYRVAIGMNSGVAGHCFYDKNKNFISGVLSSTAVGQTITTPAGTAYVRLSTLMINLTTQSLVEGTVTLSPFQPFIGSTAKITYTDPTKFDGALLPNLVRNTTAYKDGKWASVKRVQRYVLSGADVVSIGIGSNIDWAVIRSFSNGKFPLSLPVNEYIMDKYFIASSPFDELSNIGGFTRTSVSDNSVRVGLTKGTTLAAAQTALAGTVIYYELATPLTINESQFAENGIVVDGVLTSNNDFTEYFVNQSDIFSPEGVTYATNLAKSVENLKESVQGLRAVVNNQNLINLEFDARITLLE